MSSVQHKLKSVSVILSFRNEEGVIPELIERLEKVFNSLKTEYEIIFVNDDSTDNSLKVLMERQNKNKNVKIINMSRKFGVSECVYAGMKYASGDALIIMDADLQDPPEVIPQLTEKYQQGADIVYTVRRSREGEPFLKMLLTRLTYKFIGAISEISLPVEAGDFKLISRRVKDELLKINEKLPYLRGLVTWVGFKQVPVFYDRHKRMSGESHFPLFKDIFNMHGPIGAFISAVTSFSYFPPLLLSLIGLGFIFVAVILLATIVLMKILAIQLSQLYGIAFIALFFSGIQILSIGILGLYMLRIHSEVRNRPNYIVESVIGFPEIK